MKMYETVPEAIEICRNSYHGKTYTMVDEDTGEIITGSAYDIYSRQIMDELQAHFKGSWWPVDDTDVEACALMETIFCIVGMPAPRFSWEFAARDLLNQIIAEVEDK